MPDTPQDTGTPELQWSAPITAAHERTTRWYVTGGIVVFAIAAYGLLTGAWSIALVAVMCGAMYFLIRSHSFPDATMTITQNGATLNETYLPWSEAQGFWIMVTPAYAELHIVPKNPRRGEMVIQTGALDLPTLHETLLRHAPELPEKRERLVDAIIRICKL